ncbi:MAG: hypothetical protein GQ527_09235 [Bacteroidales bacterium]|nr:hypothetical protein [Bacteroidales bacterium]
MLIIIDARIPEEAINSLKKTGNVFLLKSNDIVYDSIQGHPDIFMLQLDDFVIVAPNSPKELIEKLKEYRIPFLRGKSKLGKKFPETVYYNAVSTPKYLVHKEGLTDSCVVHETIKKKFINVSQAYTRCNLLSLPDGSFITSDKGIESSLSNKGIEVHYFSSEDVLLSGQDHGFIPGACGIFDNDIYLIGSLDHYSEGERFRQLIVSKGMNIVELYQGPLIDGGGLYFLTD